MSGQFLRYEKNEIKFRRWWPSDKKYNRCCVSLGGVCPCWRLAGVWSQALGLYDVLIEKNSDRLETF
jgi:hypothetical protein